MQKGQQKRNLTSRVVKLQVDKFISNREHCLLTPLKQDTGKLNTSGFVEILQGGMKSTDKETLQISMPPELDLSIHQDYGFSLFFWLITNKPFVPKKKSAADIAKKSMVAKSQEDEKKAEEAKKKQIDYIIKKGNSVDQITPTIGLTQSQTKLFLSLKTSKSKKETIYANKPLEADHFYSIAVSFSIDYQAESTEVSIYIDGKLDTQSTVPGEPIHNQGSFFLGKPDSTCHGFRGTVADLIVIPTSILEQEIKYIHESGLETILNTDGKDIGTRFFVKEIFDRKKLISKYAKYTGKPIYQVENLGLSNERMLEVVKTFDEEEKKNDIRPQPEVINEKEEAMKENLKNFMQDDDNEIRCYKILDNQRFINTILALANKQENTYELIRMTKIFYALRNILCAEIDENFLFTLCKILNCVKTEQLKGRNEFEHLYKHTINTDKMFTNLENTILKIEEEQKLIDEENAKYAKKKQSKKSGTKSIKSLYNKSAKSSAPKSFHHSHGQYEANLETYQTIGSCIQEHEDLLLRSQPIKNAFDEEEEKALKDYHSNYVIKSLYEKPKNLPGVDPENTSYTIIDNSCLSKSNEEVDEEDDGKPKLTPEEEKHCKDFLNSIYEEYELKQNKYPVDIDVIDAEEKIEICFKTISKIREDEKQKELDKEKQKRKKEEDEKKKGLDSQEDKTRDVIEKKTNFDPDPPKEWDQGAFEIVINHCYNCVYGHRFKKEEESKKITITKSTRHYEYTFYDKFNDLGDHIYEFFPKAKIVGNLDEQEYLGNFDVYLRGTGLPGEENGKYYIYRRKDNDLKFPSNEDIIDHLVAISIIFGGSKNIEKSQQAAIMDTNRLPITHEHPVSLPPDVEKEKAKSKEVPPKSDFDPDRTKLYCQHWGCGQEFTENGNKKNKKGCKYHPGVWQFASYNNSWPACWTCCEGKWDSEGCAYGMHSGVRVDQRVKLCLNHGEINPKTGRPDSACGKQFTDKTADGCSYHSGYIDKGKWTCCSADSGAEGCIKGNHETKEYPDEEAKLRFVPLVVDNPGLKYAKDGNKERPKPTPADYIIFSPFFKNTNDVYPVEQFPDADDKRGAKILYYPDYKSLIPARKARIEKEKTEPRICIRCGQEFTQEGQEQLIKEKRKRALCKCHTGIWVFGSIGGTLKKYLELRKQIDPLLEKGELDKTEKESLREILPNKINFLNHWTCCNQTSYGAKPCQEGVPHIGPLKKYVDPENDWRFKIKEGNDDKKGNDIVLKYKWPDRRLQKVYRNQVSDKWSSYLKGLEKDDMLETVIYNSKKLNLSNLDSGSVDNFVKLLDILKITSFIIQEDPSLRMKFEDVVNCILDKPQEVVINPAEGPKRGISGFDELANICSLKYFIGPKKEFLCDKFVEWWNKDFEEIINTTFPDLDPNKKKEEKKEEKK